MPPAAIRVSRHESDQAILELASRRPARVLRRQVRAYSGYEEWARAPRKQREIPSGDVTLIVSFGPSIGISDPRAGSVVRHRSFVAGLHDGPVVTEPASYQHGVQIKLTPLGAYTLFGVPMHTLANHAVALEDILGADADRLAERLSRLPSWEARFRHLDRALMRAMDQGRAPAPTTVRAWERLEETSGRLPIGRVASELGCSRKHIAQRFREEVGVPAKTLARVLRFRHVVRLLREGNADLAEVAHRCGYSDQPHLNREFRGFAGLTPTEFAERSTGAGLSA